MSDSNRARELYAAGLRNQHAVETQAIGTLQNQIPRMDAYPELQNRMREDKDRSEQQAARLDQLLGQKGTTKSLLKEAVAGTVATVAGFVHATASDEVLKNVLAAIGFKAYEIASYKALIALAGASGAADDVAVLEGSMREEQEMGDWLGSHLPTFIERYVAQGA